MTEGAKDDPAAPLEAYLKQWPGDDDSYVQIRFFGPSLTVGALRRAVDLIRDLRATLAECDHGAFVAEHRAAVEAGNRAEDAEDEVRRLRSEVVRLEAELATERARMDWVEMCDVQIARDGSLDDFDDDEAEQWAVTVWVAGRGRTSYGGTLSEAIDRARERAS